MLTNKSKEELISIGSRFRGSYLIEQTGYSTGLVEKDSELKNCLGNVFDEIKEVFNTAKTLMADKTVASEDKKDANKKVADSMRESKVWIKRLTGYGSMAYIKNSSVSEEIIYTGKVGINVPKMLKELNNKLGLAEKFKSELAGVGMPGNFIEQGRTIYKNLEESEKIQEGWKGAFLPEKTRELYYNMGLLFYGLKYINYAAKTLYAHDAAKLASFNLNILYTRKPSSQTEEKANEENKKNN